MNSKKIYSFIGRITPLYDIFLSAVGYKKSVEYFISHLPFDTEASIRVLDAGCGTGLYSLDILKRYKNARITAFDFDNQLAERLKEKILEKKYENRSCIFANNIQGPLEEIGNEQFDLIITSGVLEYVPLESTVKNLSRSLVSNGYFLNSPVKDTLWGKFICKVYACRPYSRDENLKAFERNDFTLETVINLPSYSPASFKEAHLFKKLT